MSRMVKEFKRNSPDKILSVIGTVIIIFFLILAILAYEPDWPWTTLVMIFPILGGGLVIWNREYRKRPKSVEIYEDGVKLFFRYSKPKMIVWEDVFAINSRPGDPGTALGRWDSGGYLEMKNQFTPYFLTNEIAEQMREAYREKMGKYPPLVGT
jgi:hypothetical protein